MFMQEDDLKKLIHCLNNDLRRDIIKYLAQGSMTVPEISEILGEKRPIYRQSINRSLEILRKCGIVVKEYDENKKSLYYNLKFKKIEIDISTMGIKVYE